MKSVQAPMHRPTEVVGMQHGCGAGGASQVSVPPQSASVQAFPQAKVCATIQRMNTLIFRGLNIGASIMRVVVRFAPTHMVSR